jgi:hypothetical protein
VDHLAADMGAQGQTILVQQSAQLIKVLLEKTAFHSLLVAAVVLVKLVAQMLLELVEMVFQLI